MTSGGTRGTCTVHERGTRVPETSMTRETDSTKRDMECRFRSTDNESEVEVESTEKETI